MSKKGFRTVFYGFALAFLAAAFFVTPCFAQSSLRPAILQQFEKAGGTVTYIGSAHGLDGWIVKNPKGQMQVVYTTADGALLAGMLFDPDGVSLTEKQLEAYHNRMTGAQAPLPGAQKSPGGAEKLYAEAAQAGWVALGDSAAPYLYVFMNVNCDHCQAYWKDLQGPVKSGQLQVRLVPFGDVPANRDGGAALLSAADPAAAWAAYVGGDKEALGKDKATPAAYKKIDANTALVKKWKLPGPPFSLFRRPSDGKLMAFAGKPENMMLLLADFLK
ncbi:MAG: hypothetical protein KGL10_09465 [Alphaproteobacteria bacterium]|nr:hypothetical protein [Alphaproteobacteria bacterium]MDE2337527.1 hypothetical protein [Alphaproteobacteria bacterium]